MSESNLYCMYCGRSEETPTLRDQMAMAAMQGFIQELGFERQTGMGVDAPLIPQYKRLADISYKMADAMLQARKEQVGG